MNWGKIAGIFLATSEEKVPCIGIKVWGLLILCQFSVVQLKAQIKSNMDLITVEEQQYLTTAKSFLKEWKSAKKGFQKDSIKLSRIISKQAKELGSAEYKRQMGPAVDSLRQAYNLEELESYAAVYESYKKDKKAFEKEVFGKGSAYAKATADESGVFDEYQDEIDEYGPYAEELEKYHKYLSNPDSMNLAMNKQLARLEKMAEQRVLDLDELADLGKLQQQEKAFMSMLDMPNDIRKKMQSKVVKLEEMSNMTEEQAMEKGKEVGEREVKEQMKLLTKDQAKQIDDAVAEFSGLKKKYSSYIQTEDGTQAKKRNSLEDAAPIQRIILGGNFNVNRKESITVDFNPEIGYRLNKRVSVGGRFNYRFDFGNESWNFNDSSFVSEVKGYSAFIQHNIRKGFFLDAEFENLYVTQKEELATSDTEITRSSWSPAFKAGVGKSFRVSKIINGNVLFLYNFMYDKKSTPNRRPWQVKFGFRLNGNGVKAKQNRKRNVERVEGLYKGNKRIK